MSRPAEMCIRDSHQLEPGADAAPRDSGAVVGELERRVAVVELSDGCLLYTSPLRLPLRTLQASQSGHCLRCAEGQSASDRRTIRPVFRSRSQRAGFSAQRDEQLL